MESGTDLSPPISILLVEDEKITLNVLVAILVRKFPDIAIHAADNGRKGLELFKSVMPDIVITDINMPEMGGVQMAGEIRVIKPCTKFIAITGNNGRDDLLDSNGKEFELDHFIVKPVVFQELFAAIEQCLAGIAPPEF